MEGAIRVLSQPRRKCLKNVYAIPNIYSPVQYTWYLVF